MTRHCYIRGVTGLRSGTKTPAIEILMPTRFAINQVTTESTNIYQYVYSPRDNTLVLVDPIDIDGEVLEEEYIDWDSKWL